MRLSRALKVALVSLVVVGASLLLLYFHTIPEPWDLLLVLIVTLVCPIAGVWLTVSNIKHDKMSGAGKWQTAIAAALALAMFVYGLALLSVRH